MYFICTLGLSGLWGKIIDMKTDAISTAVAGLYRAIRERCLDSKSSGKKAAVEIARQIIRFVYQRHTANSLEQLRDLYGRLEQIAQQDDTEFGPVILPYIQALNPSNDDVSELGLTPFDEVKVDEAVANLSKLIREDINLPKPQKGKSAGALKDLLGAYLIVSTEDSELIEIDFYKRFLKAFDFSNLNESQIERVQYAIELTFVALDKVFGEHKD